MTGGTVYWAGRPSQWSTLLHYAIALVLIVGGFVLNPVLSGWVMKANISAAQPGW